MISITHKNCAYIIGDYVIKNAPIYCKGSRSARDLIKNKEIQNNNYLFARNKDDKWTITDGKSAKVDKVFFNESFIKSIPELNKNQDKIVDDKGIEKAPNIIHLKDEDKFKDIDGNVIEIETRGEREYDKIYFRVKDVTEGFNMENLENNIQKEHTNYLKNIDYKYFICEKKYNVLNKTSKNVKLDTSIKKELFLTYEGMLRVLFVSRNNKTSHFISWATKTLFTVQLGTTKQKEELVGNILGVSAKVIKEVFNAGVNTLPCIYLFTLNTVKNLRQDMNIDNKYADDSIVCKYGFTKDLTRRTAEHIETYKKINNVELKLKYYSYIDPQYISKGESDIRLFMNALNINFNYDNMEEIVIIPKELFNLVQKQYEMIGHNYMGHISEIVTKIKDLEDKYEKLQLNHMLEMQKREHDIILLNNKLEFQKEKYEHELLKKEVALMKTQMLK
jgi:hypothetical protein